MIISAKERGLLSCAECDGLPCERLDEFADSCPKLVADCLRRRMIRPEHWIAEQEECVARGVIHLDVRPWATEEEA